MVSLENKITYSERINESPKLKAFNNFLLGRPVVLSQANELSESDEVFFGILSAIQVNDKTKFETYYNKKSKSNPSKDSLAPFVNDDFLLFSIIIGVTRFNIEKNWIKSIVELRNKSAITTTLVNILSENFTSTNNLQEIVLMFLQFTNQSLITNDVLNLTFKKINENINLLESKSDFQILCAINAYNEIIQLKEAPDGSEIQLLKVFNNQFIQRTKILSWILQACLLFCFFYFLLKLPLYSPSIVKVLDSYGYIFNIIGVIGFTFIGTKLKFIRINFQDLVMWLLGYPKELRKVLRKDETN